MADTGATVKDIIAASYALNISDEFVLPTVIAPYEGMRDGDGVLMGNFRSDRAREILTALLDPSFDGFPRQRVDQICRGALGMVEYSSDLNRVSENDLSAAESDAADGRDRLRRRQDAAPRRRDGKISARHLLL